MAPGLCTNVFGWTYNNKSLDMQLSYDSGEELYIIPAYLGKVFLILQNRIGATVSIGLPPKSIPLLMFNFVPLKHNICNKMVN